MNNSGSWIGNNKFDNRMLTITPTDVYCAHHIVKAAVKCHPFYTYTVDV